MIRVLLRRIDIKMCEGFDREVRSRSLKVNSLRLSPENSRLVCIFYYIFIPPHSAQALSGQCTIARLSNYKTITEAIQHIQDELYTNIAFVIYYLYSHQRVIQIQNIVSSDDDDS